VTVHDHAETPSAISPKRASTIAEIRSELLIDREVPPWAMAPRLRTVTGTLRVPVLGVRQRHGGRHLQARLHVAQVGPDRTVTAHATELGLLVRALARE